MKKTETVSTGSTLVVTVSVVATVLVLLGSAVSYTQHISKISQRSRKTAQAMEIADGHLEYLFTNWRNTSRISVMQSIKKKVSVANVALPTQYFFTDSYNPGPTPVPSPSVTGLTTAPPIIPLPDKTLFPTEPNYTVTQYRIQAVDPMTTLDSNENALINGAVNPAATPPAAFGPNTSTTNGQYSFYYLASVDVKVPAVGTQSGYVTAKVRRVFEKKYDEPFTFAMFYMDDLELQPSTSLTITGPIHTNSSLYIGTSNFTAQAASTPYPTSGKVTYSTSYVNGQSPSDPTSRSFTTPSLPSNEPPMMQSSYLPFGWNPNLSDTNANNDSYHDLIERPDTTIADDITGQRFYTTAVCRVLIDQNNTVTVDAPTLNGGDINKITGALTFNEVIQDVREGGAVRITTLDVSQLPANTGLDDGTIYISDTSAGTPVTFLNNGVSVTTSKRGIRLKKGGTIPPNLGLTFVCENPVYIQGDYNTTSPRQCAIVGDAINLLSNAWNDTTPSGSRVASNTTVRAALVGGNVPSDGSHYSGGGENFIRLLENWSGMTLTYYGSMVQLWQSKQATGFWSSSSTIYTAPTTNNWYYDTSLATNVPPGTFQLAAYLQQQRWYQVY